MPNIYWCFLLTRSRFGSLNPRTLLFCTRTLLFWACLISPLNPLTRWNVGSGVENGKRDAMSTAHACEVIRAKRWPHFQDGVSKSKFFNELLEKCSFFSQSAEKLPNRSFIVDEEKQDKRTWCFLAFCKFLNLIGVLPTLMSDKIGLPCPAGANDCLWSSIIGKVPP